jgi:hypothetical protein
VSRAKTAEEARAEFLDAIRQMTYYWAKVPQGMNVQERLDGLAFSILNILDGTSGTFSCAIDLVLRPHPDNKAFHQAEGENWYEDGMAINECQLHELYYRQPVDEIDLPAGEAKEG